jgi:hypothetical protein
LIPGTTDAIRLLCQYFDSAFCFDFFAVDFLAHLFLGLPFLLGMAHFQEECQASIAENIQKLITALTGFEVGDLFFKTNVFQDKILNVSFSNRNRTKISWPVSNSLIP